MIANKLQSFRFWCQKVIPLVYDNSLSYYEVLCKVVDYTNKIIENEKEIGEELEQYGTDLETLKKDVFELQKGSNANVYIMALKDYITYHIADLIGDTINLVVFGLSTDGHFVAYKPSGWDSLTFDTVMDSESELYGHLILSY